MTWKLLNHTSDLKIEVSGRSEEQLFENAAQAVSAQIVEPGDIKDVSERCVRVKAESREERFLDWLRELLHLITTKGFQVGRVKKVTLLYDGKDFIAEAVAVGEETDLNRHRLLHEIKTVTYQDYFYGKTEDCWKARVVLDV